MAAFAELGPLKGLRGREAIVRQDGPRRGCRALGAARWAKALVLAHMTGRTDEPGLAQPRIKGRVRTIGAPVLALGQLFTEGRVAGGTEGGGGVIHLQELARDTRPHTAAMEAALPVLILLRMTDATVLRM